MLLRYSNDLCSRVGQTHFAGDQTYDGAESDHPEADPDPRYQREDIGLNNARLLSVERPAKFTYRSSFKRRRMATSDTGCWLAYRIGARVRACPETASLVRRRYAAFCQA